MLFKFQVFSLALNEVDINVSCLNYPQEIAKTIEGEKVYVKIENGDWVVFDTKDAPVTGLLATRLIEYATNHFPKEVATEGGYHYYFLLEEIDHERNVAIHQASCGIN